MEAIIFTGIQASGKTTFYKQRFFTTHVRINLDMLKTRRREDILLRACLKAEQRFVVDNTNTLVAERAKYINLAKSAGFRIIGYYFESTLQDSIRRNENRTGSERIPVKGLEMMQRRLLPPTYAEGFDELHIVRINDEGGFDLRDMPPAES
jgi:predicted kinase